MRSGFLALFLALPVAACGSPDSSVSGVFPSSAFLGRQLRVEISGDVTEWKSGASVEFGEGVTVQSVNVASPTALFADITVMPDATPGLRDVTVRHGGDTLVLEEAFQLESAITLKFRGSVAQGSIATFAIQNHDFDTPFDDTATGDGFFTPLEYTNTFIETAPGTRLDISSIDAYNITGTAFFDVDATPGPIVVHSGLDTELVQSSLGTPLEVAPRTAMQLTAGMSVTANVEAPFASALYEFTPAGSPALATFSATSTSQAAAPGLVLLPASGKFDELISYGATGAVVQETAGKLYAVYFDNGGGSGYNYSVRANSAMLTSVAESEPNNSTGNASVMPAMPSLFANASLASVSDVDWIGIDIAQGDMGKKIHVITTGADPLTDTVVEVFQGNGTTTFGGPSRDSGYHENHTTPALANPGRYWVKVTASQDFFVDSHNQYSAAIWLE